MAPSTSRNLQPPLACCYCACCCSSSFSCHPSCSSCSSGAVSQGSYKPMSVVSVCLYRLRRVDEQRPRCLPHRHGLSPSYSGATLAPPRPPSPSPLQWARPLSLAFIQPPPCVQAYLQSTYRYPSTYGELGKNGNTHCLLGMCSRAGCARVFWFCGLTICRAQQRT